MKPIPTVVIIQGKAVNQHHLECPECGSTMELRGINEKLYYVCISVGCKGIHGSHPDGKPLGIPAKANIRKARSAAHIAFDRIWEHKKMTRTEAYAWLSKIMGVQEAHIGNFDAEQCRKIVTTVKTEFPELFPFSDDIP